MGRSSGNLSFNRMMKKSREKMLQISSKDFNVFIEFFTVLRNLLAGRIDARGARAILQGLCRGDTELMLKQYNFPPKQYQTILPFQLSEMTGVKRKKVKTVEENCELPCDVLENILKTLDFDDLFHFSGVCKNWRAFHKIYLTNFLAYHEPLLLQILFDGERKESFSLISISNKKVYSLKMMDCIVKSHYLAFSGGYFVKVESFNNKFLLINPFTRIKKVINAFTFKLYRGTYANHALLAFSKCSEEFVLVVLCISTHSLRVYHSRNFGWVTYSSTMENKERVVHSVVLHNIIYIVTDKANIGVLSLNSPNIKFLKLKNTPDATNINFKLVNCDEQLLVVDIIMWEKVRNVYKIDFSTMSYVKLENLGDIALFYAFEPWLTRCYALSNPSRWGYESNSMYVTSVSSTICRVYSGDDKKLKKCIMLPTPGETGHFMFDWCFSHLQYKIDYSLVE